MRKLAFCLALFVGAASGSALAGPQLWNLGAGKVTGMAPGSVVVAYDSGGSAKIWSPAYGSVSLGAGSTAGCAWKGTTLVVAGLVAGKAQRWDGNAAGSGSWSVLPLDGGCDWVPLCIGASPTDVSIGGYCPWEGVDYGNRYQESKGITWEGIRPGKPQFEYDYDNNSYVRGITADNVCAGEAKYHAPNQARQAIGGQNVPGIDGLQGFNNLYGPPDTSHESSAYAIAADGSRIVGWSWAPGAAQNQAVYWDAPYSNYQTPTAIPLLPGYYWARAFGVSPNGAYVVGSCYRQTDDALAAWVWDSVNGTRNLADVLAAAGIDLTGWTLAVSDVFQMGPTAVSSDGKWFCGTGLKDGVETAWVAFIPEPGSLSVLAAGLLGLLAAYRRRS